MRNSQISFATARRSVSRSISTVNFATASPNTRDWVTTGLFLGPGRADRTILMICTRYESGSNAIFNWTLGTSAGIRLHALAPNNSSTIDIVMFPNRTDTIAAISATGGNGSITSNYRISLFACYGFGLPFINQSSGSDDTGFNDTSYRSYDLNNDSSTSLSVSGIRRSPTVLACAAVADFTASTQTASSLTSTPAGITTVVNIDGAGSLITNFSSFHGISVVRSDTTYSGSASWSTVSRLRQLAIVPIF